jgi:hypothetical protein
LNNKNEGDETKNSISLHLVSFLFKINVLYFKEKIFIKANRNNLGDFFPNPCLKKLKIKIKNAHSK